MRKNQKLHMFKNYCFAGLFAIVMNENVMAASDANLLQENVTSENLSNLTAALNLEPTDQRVRELMSILKGYPKQKETLEKQIVSFTSNQEELLQTVTKDQSDFDSISSRLDQLKKEAKSPGGKAGMGSLKTSSSSFDLSIGSSRLEANQLRSRITNLESQKQVASRKLSSSRALLQSIETNLGLSQEKLNQLIQKNEEALSEFSTLPQNRIAEVEAAIAFEKQEEERKRLELLADAKAKREEAEKIALEQYKQNAIRIAEESFSQLSLEQADEISKKMISLLPCNQLRGSIASETHVDLILGNFNLSTGFGGSININNLRMRISLNAAKTLIIIDINDTLAFIKHDPQAYPTFSLYQRASNLTRQAVIPPAEDEKKEEGK